MGKYYKRLSWWKQVAIALVCVLGVMLAHNLPSWSQEAPIILKVATEPTFPPFEMQAEQGGEIVGFDIDLFNAIGKEGGFKIQVQSLPFDGLIPALQSKQIDAAISGMSITAERALTVDFSRPYFRSGIAIAIKEQNENIKGFEDLKGKRIAVQIGTTSAKEAAKIPDAKISTFDNTILSLQELANGNVDAVMNDEPVILFAVRKSNLQGLKVVGNKLTEEYYGIAFPKGSPNVEKVNKGLGLIIANGTYKEIYQKWFAGVPPELPEVAPALANQETATTFSIFAILPNLLWGALITVGLAALSILLGMVGGTGIALAQISNNPILKILATLYVDFFRGTPLLVQLFMIYFGIPAILQQMGVTFSFEKLPAAVTALAMNASAYLGEIIRGGIQSVDRGQWEASECLGMDASQTMSEVIFPQALRRMLPPLGNEFITMVKDTSLVAIIGFEELFRRGQLEVANSYRAFEIYAVVALIYLVLTFVLAKFFNWLEVQMNPVEKAKQDNARRAAAEI